MGQLLPPPPLLTCFSHVRLCVTLWPAVYQAPLFMGFSRQEYRVGCHALLQGIFPTQGSNLGLLDCREISLLLSHQGSPFGQLLVTQSCSSLWDPTDCGPPGFSVYGILQARVLEWIASSRGTSQPRDQTLVSCIAGRFFTV